jgi:hypothetical protein
VYADVPLSLLQPEAYAISMNPDDQESRVVRMARRFGLRLITCIRPAGYILVTRRNVVEFGASLGSRRATLDEIELYLTNRPPSAVSERKVALRKQPRWMKGGSWP